MGSPNTKKTSEVMLVIEMVFRFPTSDAFEGVMKMMFIWHVETVAPVCLKESYRCSLLLSKLCPSARFEGRADPMEISHLFHGFR